MGKQVKVEGEVFIRTNAKTMILKFYEEDFILDDEILTLEQARSFIKKGLIKERLRKKIEGFKGVRTCQVIEFKDTDKKPEVSKYEALLVKAQKANCLPQSLDNYADEESKIRALNKALDSEKKRKAQKKNTAPVEEGYVD